MRIDIDVIMVVVALIGVVIALYKIQRSNSREMQQISDKVIENEKSIDMVNKNMIQSNDDLATEIDELKKLHAKDVSELYKSIQNAVDKTTGIEERHHCELVQKIDGLTLKVTTMCATFEEYRRNK